MEKTRVWLQWAKQRKWRWGIWTAFIRKRRQDEKITGEEEEIQGKCVCTLALNKMRGNVACLFAYESDPVQRGK